MSTVPSRFQNTLPHDNVRNIKLHLIMKIVKSPSYIDVYVKGSLCCSIKGNNAPVARIVAYGAFLSCLNVCFVALRPMSTAMVIAERSVHLTTLFTGQA